jgi:hypothetical protein
MTGPLGLLAVLGNWYAGDVKGLVEIQKEARLSFRCWFERSKQVVKLPRSDGVVGRSQAVRRAARFGRMHDYFYGSNSTLSPHPTTVSFSAITIVKLSGVAVR